MMGMEAPNRETKVEEIRRGLFSRDTTDHNGALEHLASLTLEIDAFVLQAIELWADALRHPDQSVGAEAYRVLVSASDAVPLQIFDILEGLYIDAISP